MSALKKYSVSKALLVLGLCLTITLGAFVTLAPAPVLASTTQDGGQAIEQAQEDTGYVSRGDLRRNDPDFDWNYALYTLIIRFVGIFIVLGFIQVIMQISGRFFTRLEQKKKAQAQASK
ncbi:MAG: hypothetical protein JEZ02_06210 [Desulfatibacillum sp.]|nr:hypothetical protein [Desulfatibacillum sp.]